LTPYGAPELGVRFSGIQEDEMKKICLLTLLMFSLVIGCAEISTEISSVGEKMASVTKSPQHVKQTSTVVGVVVTVKNGEGADIQMDQDSMRIIRRGKGAELANMVGKKVEAIGTVSERKGKKYIYIKEFKESPTQTAHATEDVIKIDPNLKIKQERKKIMLDILLHTPTEYLKECQHASSGLSTLITGTSGSYQCAEVLDVKMQGDTLIYVDHFVYRNDYYLKPVKDTENSNVDFYTYEQGHRLEFQLEDKPHVVESDSSYSFIKLAEMRVAGNRTDIVIQYPKNSDALILLLKSRIQRDAIEALESVMKSTR